MLSINLWAVKDMWHFEMYDFLFDIFISPTFLLFWGVWMGNWWTQHCLGNHLEQINWEKHIQASSMHGMVSDIKSKCFSVRQCCWNYTVTPLISWSRVKSVPGSQLRQGEISVNSNLREELVNSLWPIDSGNGLLPDGTKPLPAPMLTSY